MGGRAVEGTGLENRVEPSFSMAADPYWPTFLTFFGVDLLMQYLPIPHCSLQLGGNCGGRFGEIAINPL
jgi:hypothetical protein